MKHVHRFFVSRKVTSGMEVPLDDEDTFRSTRVLRLTPGAAVEIADCDGRIFSGEVAAINEKVIVLAEGVLSDAETLKTGLTVAQAITRGSKMDLIVEKLSELGVSRLVPLATEMSVELPGYGGEKFKRWRRIARAAASQSKRRDIMDISDPLPVIDWLRREESQVIVLTTEADAAPLGRVVEELGGPVSLVVGPEAGFSNGEIDAIALEDAVFAGLGEQVLRTETAALTAAAIVLHRLGRIG